MPGGVNSPVRAMRAIGRDPIFIDRAHGAELFDVDGNRFIDYVCSWGPLIHGHAHPAVVEAVARASEGGMSFGAPTLGEIKLAEEICERMPAVEMLRMTSSGTEASMTALRLARAATGASKVLKFAGAYHGHVDGLLAQAGSGLATQALPSSPGVPAAVTADTLVVPWNDPQALIAATEEYVVADTPSEAGQDERPGGGAGGQAGWLAGRQAGGLAAILAEGIPANMGVVPAREGFMELLRERADACGALLVLDEVISGFRVARGGAQERMGVQGDLVVLGKIIGGGLPAGAVGGRAMLLERLAPAGEVYQAGTLSGNPLAVAAGLATLELLDEQAYLRLTAITEHLADGLREAAAAAGRAVAVVQAPGLLTVFFSEQPPASLAEVQRCDLEAYGAWCRGLLARGVYPPPSQFEAWFPSLAHTQEQIERTVEAARAAFAELAS